jgi:hypothetical protein
MTDEEPKTDFKRHQELARRWEASAGMSFKEFSDARFEALKLVGGGNATGLLSVAAFLAAGKIAPNVIAAKICLTVFSIGVVTFGLPYWHLYGWRGSLDRALALFAKNKSLDDSQGVENLHAANREFNSGANFGLVSLLCLCVGGAIALVGILFTY